MKWPLAGFVVAWPGPAAAPAPACGRQLTGRRPLSAGRTSATAGSSRVPGGEAQKAVNDILDSFIDFQKQACRSTQ